jgi:hypothetical protein
MNKQNALKRLLIDHNPPNSPSTRYGRTMLARALVAWDVALGLSKGNEKKVTGQLLDDCIEAIDRGDNVIDALYELENVRHD